MIIPTAPAGKPRLAIMMNEHTALSGQFARAFCNDLFEAAQPDDLLFYVVSHHDEGWAEFDRDPVTDQNTGLPCSSTPSRSISTCASGRTRRAKIRACAVERRTGHEHHNPSA